MDPHKSSFNESNLIPDINSEEFEDEMEELM